MNSLFSLIYTKKYVNKMSYMIKSLGIESNITLDNFFITRFFIEAVLFIILLLIPNYGILLGLISVFLFHYLYEIMLIRYRVYKRSMKIINDANRFFYLFKLGLESNSSVDKVLIITIENVNNSFANELKVVGKSGDYKTTFKSVIDRIPDGRVKNIIKDLLLCDTKTEIEGILEEYLKIENNIKNDSGEHFIHILPLKIILLIIVFLISIIFILLYTPSIL